MFSTGSPYSPFFTSGLLSSNVSPEPPLGPRRGSLPTDSSTDQSSAFYFTLRDQIEFRSFLSLDLAESQSLRSASLKRKAESKPPLRVPMSRDSLRTIPSPKPAPSITLPDLPPRLPSLAFSGLSLEHPSYSTPSLASPPISRNLPKRFSTGTKSATSSARRINRSDALARLEGRSFPREHHNFINLDDDDADADTESFDLCVDEPEDVVLPPTKFPSLHPSKDWFPLNSFIDLRSDDDAWSWRSWIQVPSVA